LTSDLAVVITGVLFQALAFSPLYLFAGLGEIIGEKSGVVNLGIEGIMLMSVLTMYMVDILAGSPWIGILAALAIAGVVGAIFAYLTVQVRLEQIVLGLAIYFFALGVTSQVYNTSTLPQRTFSNLGGIYILGLSDIPVLGKVLFQQNILFYFSIAMVVMVAYFLQRTSFGLRVRAVGENPKAADNMGVNVQKVRFLAVLVGAILMGLAGAYFEVGFLQSFNYDVLAGKGFIVLAIIYLANWGPYKTLFAVVSFNIVGVAASTYVNLSSTAYGGASALYVMIQYVYLLALIPIMGRSAKPPKYLLKPYRKG
jgi:simple sugar transport system permease protein